MLETLIFMVAPVVMGFGARRSSWRMSFPQAVSWLYLYLFWLGVGSLGGLALLLSMLLTDTATILSEATPFGVAFLVVFFVVTAFLALRFWAFDRFYASDPNKLPLGVRAWAYFSPRALEQTEDGLVDTASLEERFSWAKRGPVDAARAKVEAFQAKADAYDLAAAKEHEEAQMELQRAARDYNEAKLRADEAERRRKSRGNR